MRVDDILKQVIQQNGQTTGQSSSGTDTSFDLLLQSEISSSEAQSAPNSDFSGVEDLSGTLNIQPLISNATPASSESQALGALDDAMNQLTSLNDAISRNKSPKEINSLIEQHNSGAAGLDDKLSGLASNHPLRDISEELKVTSYMESVKLKRGDYS